MEYLKVFIELHNGYTELVGIIESSLYDKLLPILEQEAKERGGILTEAVTKQIS